MPYSEEKPVRRNLRCPHCKSDDLAFVAEYHKSAFLKFLEQLCIAILFIILFVNIDNILSLATNKSDPAILLPIIMLLIFYVSFKSIRHYIESKTHVQAICRGCGELWLLN